MRPDRFTTKFAEALGEAQGLALSSDHQLIEPVHVMVALLDQEGGASRHLLTKAGVRVNPLRSALGERLDSLPRVSGADGEINLSNELIKQRLNDRKDHFVGSEMLDSQFDALEEPKSATVVSVTQSPQEIVGQIIGELELVVLC